MQQVTHSVAPPPAHRASAPTTIQAADAGPTREVDGLPGHFGLHFQPEVDLETGEVAGCEALLRWWHPDFGMLHPGTSLRLTRWDGWLGMLEGWALRTACRQAAAWSQAGTPLPVAVNVSELYLGDPDFLAEVERALTEAGTPPELLDLDLPAAGFTREPESARALTASLRDLGVGVVADGLLGVRSLDLEGVEITAVKVPVQVVRPVAGSVHPAMAAPLELAGRAGAKAVAKGVEHAVDLPHLRAAGFDRALGKVFSPPLTAEALGAVASRPSAVAANR
jgi:EAL domain-containing protein (putative c-di-GMP-specific phosphodiesterase class I)